jgi:transcription initiation factor TFIIIB Brf1 subunit/transcription initiation factor TFIIB
MQVLQNKKCSYDENDYENYFEDKERVCDGSEQHPEFTKNHVLTKNKEKSLKKDLEAAGFPPEIVVKADEIYGQMDSGLKRGAKYRQLMFFCVHAAYNTLRIPEDPSNLARMCNISVSEISKAFSMCSPSKTNYKPPCIHWEPRDYLKFYYKKIIDLDIISFHDGVLEDINSICSEVMEKNRELKDEKPQTVAAAVLVFYLQLHGCAIDVKKYNEIFSRSQMTIGKVKNKVALAYNS